MPAIAVPKTRVLTGAGFLYRAPLGTLLPGQTSATVTNKAITAGVATITTASAHGFLTGDKVIVSIGDSAFDGLQTLVSGSGTTFTYNVSTTTVATVASSGTVYSNKAGGTVAGGVFTDAWPTGWTPIGVTKSGHEFSYAPKTGQIEVAEFLIPLRIVTTGVEVKMAFEIAQFTASNFAFSLNGGSITTVSGTGLTQLTEVNAPVVGQEVRQMIGWESEDSTERLLAVQCFQQGDVKIKHNKGTDHATITTEFGIEQPSVGQPFRRFYAGTTPVV